jgi:hypothetical protein
MAEVGGIRRPLHCPRCGATNALGGVVCRVCKIDLTAIDRLPPEALRYRCPHCLEGNPAPYDLNRAAFCIGCGREIHFPGQSRVIGLTDVAATPGVDVCPHCRQKSRALRDIHTEQPSTWLTRHLAPPVRPWIVELASQAQPSDDFSASVDGVALGVPSLSLPVRGLGAIDRITLAIQRIAWRLGLGGLRTYRRRKLREYRDALDRWSRAHYCATDAIVFVRRATAVSTSTLRGYRAWLWADRDA